jgi:hypothetical protein
MGALMGVKKTGALLDQLTVEAKKQGAKWETIQDVIAQLWSIKKEIIIEFLPTLLNP